jgi:hypothetical protein
MCTPPLSQTHVKQQWNFNVAGPTLKTQSETSCQRYKVLCGTWQALAVLDDKCQRAKCAILFPAGSPSGVPTTTGLVRLQRPKCRAHRCRYGHTHTLHRGPHPTLLKPPPALLPTPGLVNQKASPPTRPHPCHTTPQQSCTTQGRPNEILGLDIGCCCAASPSQPLTPLA